MFSTKTTKRNKSLGKSKVNKLLLFNNNKLPKITNSVKPIINNSSF